MQEKYYAWLIFIAVLVFAAVGLILIKGNLTGAQVAESQVEIGGDEPIAEQTPSEEDELKKKQEQIEEAVRNATTQAIKDVTFLACMQVGLHKALPPGSVKGVVQKRLIKINGHEETKIDGFPDKCSENGKKAIVNYCIGKQVFQKEKVCDKRCVAGICA
jgi:hypothetical protein